MNIRDSIVAILNSNGKIVGTGFLASQNLVVTCAHVVIAADAIDGDTVQVRFDGRDEILDALVVPEYWRDINKGDVAILRLETVPGGITPIPLGNAAGSAGHDFYAYGYATVTDVQGIGARGKIVDIVDNGRLVQLTSQEPDHGMSGGPVLDEQRRVVIGMVTKGQGLLENQNLRNTQTTFATTVEIIREVCTELRLTEICPYRSLDVFNEEDAPFFFGREKFVQNMLDNLKHQPRFLAVLGPSGSGKSSVVRAGLIPALRKGKVLGSQKWDIITIRPAHSPFEQLAGAGLVQPHDGLENAVRTWLAGRPGKSKLVIVIDQFEEVLVATPQDIRQEFIIALAQLLDSPDDIAIILTLRDDFYSMFVQECTKIADWLQRRGLVNIPATLDEDELRAIMIEPAKNEGVGFEDGLVNVILDAVTAISQTEKVVRNTILPLLEFTLTQLWENRIDGRLTHAAYKSLGGVSGGLAHWANKAHYSFNDADRKRSRNIFCSLVHLGNPERGIPDSRRQCALDDLASDLAEQGEIRRVVNTLADARLIVTGQNDRKQETVDLIHDSLIAEWMQLQRWVEEDRKFLIWKQRIEERILDWKSEDGDLLRGNALVSAKEFLETHGERLDEAVVTYINKSIIEEEQIQQKMLSAAQPTTGEITDLEVSILEQEKGQFVMELSYSAPGIEITETANASFDILELDNARFDMDEYSHLLSNMFFADDKMRTLFIRAYDNAVTLGLDLRLRFRIQNGSLYNEYWETLRHPLTGALLGNDERILISRYQTSRSWNPVKLNARSNLKALLMIANPHDLDKYKLPPLDARLEIEFARKSLGNIPSTILEKATLNNLRDALRKNTPDIVYIFSYGYGSAFFWEDDDGSAKRVLGDEIAACFTALKSPPALVVLGSTQYSSHYQGSINTLGALLIQAGIPAALSIMGNISLQTWHTFVPVFFASLQSDGSVDRAITVARNSVRDRFDAWAPILLMRLKNGKIFV